MNETDFNQINQLINEVEKVILGKRKIIQLTVAALLAGSHVLFEDIPGVGKTVLVKSLAKAIHGDFSRIQFTPDLLPSDILGVSIFNAKSNDFEFHSGPIFANILLADEINRTTPRTQAALLEAMSENSVTIDGHTYPLPPNFLVLATQNPLDYEGTYPLPEAQLDRFLFSLNIGYPSVENELKLMLNQPKTADSVKQVMNEDTIRKLKIQLDNIHVDEAVARYALALVQKSRNHPSVELGLSPRGSIAFIRGAKAFAMTEGRSFVTPNDLQSILPAVFKHRLQLKSRNVKRNNLLEITDDIINSVPIPFKR
ncbi:MAG: MoxR family ATPase [Streptococcaceae bacterium]|nr:MoxR family ATPase [Streptococcaceae bacterium]MCH4178094.1 MoxR family ATPase [Streptococcaceae bacterium]